ncbi:MAG: extracellular solute-binding protein [Fimbriimonadaceae bacterium]|nr:extracellular solute-binding protein [Fimbriimonadaceae bacterium]
MLRRTVSGRWWIGAGLLVLMAGCATSSDSSGAKSSVADAPAADAKLSGTLEVQAFQGGYGIDFYQASAKEFAALHPDLKIEVSGSPRVWESLTPRFANGNPPDLTFPGWGMRHWDLAEEDQLLDLGQALDGPAHDGKGTWRETFDPQILKLGQLGGKQYTLPYYVMIYGWWYDPGVFTKNGWKVPKTYPELLTLCDKIKASGIAPLTYQGKYPYYLIDGMLLPWVQDLGGIASVNDLQNLEPGAWKSDAVKAALRRILELKDKGFFQKGAAAMSHTEAQQEFVQGRAAMIPCGSWLYSEMKATLPKGAQMEYFLPPVSDKPVGDPSAVLIGIEPWMVPSGGKNPDAAIAFFRYMTSPSVAAKFVREKGTLTAIKGSDEGADLPPILAAPRRALRESKTVYAVQFRHWYPNLSTELENALTSLMTGQTTVDALCERVESAAEKIRQDPNISKHRVD